MKVILFGGSGMVGQGVLRECLADDRVTQVVSVGRRALRVSHPKLCEVLRQDLADLSPVEADLAGADGVFYCLGVSSVGLKEDAYRRVTVDLTQEAVRAVRAASGDEVRFLYVSGGGTDSTEQGRVMWARVKGEAENLVLAAFPRAVMFRPGFIQPRDGIRSKTAWYAAVYAVTGVLTPVLRLVAPGTVNDTREIGRAMLNVAAGTVSLQVEGKRILDPRDIALAAEGPEAP